jgi:hypothetical protein
VIAADDSTWITTKGYWCGLSPTPTSAARQIFSQQVAMPRVTGVTEEGRRERVRPPLNKDILYIIY